MRSAEYWLQMGYPELALEELQTLPESARLPSGPRPLFQISGFSVSAFASAATVAKLHQVTA